MTPAEHDSRNAASSVPVDLVHLHRYTLGNVALDREVLDLFRQTAPAYLDALRQAGEHKAWIDAAHAIKGSAKAIGAWKVGLIAERLEKLPGAPAAAEGAQLIAELSDALAAVDRFIADLAARS